MHDHAVLFGHLIALHIVHLLLANLGHLLAICGLGRAFCVQVLFRFISGLWHTDHLGCQMTYFLVYATFAISAFFTIWAPFLPYFLLATDPSVGKRFIETPEKMKYPVKLPPGWCVFQ